MADSSGAPHTLDLRSFKLLSFDVYCTLVDYDTGAYNSAVRNLQRLPGLSAAALPARHALLSALEAAERQMQAANPGMSQTEVHKQSFIGVARDLLKSASDGGDSNSETSSAAALLEECGDGFAAEVPLCPAFADTLAALRALAQHYKLVPLSNIDRASFTATLERGGLQGAPFAAYYLAEDIGSYKPDRRNFEYLLSHAKEEFGVEKDEVLHVGNSLFHDMRPAGEMGLKRVWVDRRGLVEGDQQSERDFGGRKDLGLDGVGWELRVNTMEELAGIVEEAWKEGQGTGKRYVH
jgi:2-haloalkanoic acid dehalogenase type II